MKSKVQRSLTYWFLFLSTATLLRADREADRRNEIIPTGHQMRPPIHKSIVPFASGATPTGYTPQQMRHAYGFDQLGATGAGQTIAIIDAYGSPTIQADLDTFCAQFGIPSTTVAIYYPQGTPGTNSGWAGETSLDVEWAHAIAPGATIVLVASKSASTTDLFAAVDYAVGLGARQISMSWGGSEFSTEATSDFHFNVPGVTFFASSGDSGAGVSYPAVSPFVVGVGGTSLHLDSSNNVTSETAWSGSGGGISAYEPIPSYQTGWLTGTKRGVPDVAYDADPNTGVPVYQTGPGWGQFGGTSMSAPQWAALCAIVNSLRSQSIDSAPSLLYSLASSNYAGYFRDITSGSNGNPAGTRYDLVTGLGSPLGNQLVLALSGAPPQAAAPVFSPPAGVYLNAQTVTITSATSGVSIRYTTDGSTPTETNGTLYSGPVSISSTVTLQAIAYGTGFSDSTVTSGTYTIGSQQVAAPTFSPAAGNYITSVTVTISSVTSGASIRYTTDGSAPSETNGTLYSGPVAINITTNLQAVAYESGFIDSSITSGTFKIFPAQPTFSPGTGTYSSAVNVTITSTTPGASIRYTTDGSTPAFNSGTLYSGSVSITATTTLKAIAYYQVGSTIYVGPVVTGTYTLPPPAAAPAFSPAAGTYTSGQAVTIISATPGASIRYTTNGVPPSETYGTLYSGAVAINATTTLQAIAYGAGLSDSNITTGVYTINLSPAVAPVFSPAADTYANSQTVTITSATSGATILYTTDGSIPTENNGTIYSGPVNVGRSTMLKAIAYKSGAASDSPVTSGLYTINSSPAAVINDLCNFASFSSPTGMVQGSDGNFYGISPSGGSLLEGTVFKLTPADLLTTLAIFNGPNGTNPSGGLVEASDGNFYGTTSRGGANGDGTIFKITPAGVLTTLVSFDGTNGADPASALVQGSDGNFYGTTVHNSDLYSGYGTVFRMTPAGALTTLFSFSGANGSSPEAALVQGSDGNFYGTTASGGDRNAGTVFKITPAGILTTLASFSVGNGSGPMGALLQGSDGNFYGTTEGGGPGDNGTVFKITPNGVLTTLAFLDYNVSSGTAPYAGLLEGFDGNFYGTTFKGGDPSAMAGTIFRITPSGVLTNLISFDGANGDLPEAGLILGNDGNFYGTTENGVFQLIIPAAAAAPVFSPPVGSYASAQNVTITSATSGATIRYTTDGSTPSETAGTIYSGPVSISANTTLAAIAYKTGIADSAVVSGLYRIGPQVAAPTFNPPTGNYTSIQSVAISTATPGATIRYTTDGSLPSEVTGTVYSGPVSITKTTTLNAIAYGAGFGDSPVVGGTYTLNLPPAAAPSFSPAPGTYTSVQTVTITSASPGVTIRYAINGLTPSENAGAVYSGPVTINATTTLKAIAYGTGFTDSSVTSGFYTINLPPAAAPTFSPNGGTYTSAQTVAITSATGGATIRYTTDGSTPNETYGTVYSGPVSIGASTTLKAMAYETGYTDSNVVNAIYTINFPPAAAPTFSLGGGTYTNAQTVAITSATSGVTIRYTIDGSTPTETNGTVYSGPVSIISTMMLKAIAYENGFSSSAVAGELYTITSSPAPVLNVLYDFTSANSEGYGTGGVIQGSDGNFYGTTKNGGSSFNGTAFKITPAGVFTTLALFTSANDSPYASLIQGSDGNFYGTTEFGGAYGNNGTIFKMTPGGILTTLASFNSINGSMPQAPLIQGSDGNFYGTTYTGGSSGDGNVFEVTPTGVLTSLASFNGIGTWPRSGLVQDSNGNFYGTTEFGGPSNQGIIFKLTPAGVLTALISFNGANGSNPYAGLLQGSDGNFYGTTHSGGISNQGVVFKLTPAGTLTVLVSFNYTNGAFPSSALVQGSDGNFYGTTSGGGNGGYGTIFRITSAGVLTTLVSFDSANGSDSETALVQGNDGNFYGTTVIGGSFSSGVVFQLILPRAAAPVFNPTAGVYTIAQSVTITTATSGATIRYTTDGSAPTETNGTIYSGPVTIGSTTALQAIAYEAGFTDSTISSAIYTITTPVPGWTVKDFDGDSGADVLWRNSTTGDFGIWAMAGTTPTGFTPMGNVPGPWSIAAVGDFNHDGKADILWRNATTGEVGVMLMNGTAIGSYVGLGVVDLSWSVVGLGDFNNDGQTDILWQNTSGALGFWALNGTTVTGFTPIGTLPAPWTIAGVGDFNGDGKSDLLWYDPTTGNLVVSLMNGTTITSFEPLIDLPLPWTVAGVADFNSDGSPDLLLHDPTTGNVGVLLMNGATPTSFSLAGSVPAPWQPLD